MVFNKSQQVNGYLRQEIIWITDSVAFALAENVKRNTVVSLDIKLSNVNSLKLKLEQMKSSGEQRLLLLIIHKTTIKNTVLRDDA